MSPLNKVRSLLSKLRKTPQTENVAEQLATPADKWQDGWSWIPDWQEIFHGDMDEWRRHVEAAKKGKRLLIATCVGGNSAMTPMESLFAVAFTLRQARVEILLCDKALPACMNIITSTADDQKDFIAHGPKNCDWCYESGARVFKDLGLYVHKLSDWILKEDVLQAQSLSRQVTLEDAATFMDEGVLVGHHAVTGALRYFGRGDFDGEPNALPIMRKFLEAGIITNRAAQRLYKERGYEHTVINQGIYVPQGIVTEVARKVGSTLAAFELAYRKKSVSIDNWTKAYQENNAQWESLPWNDSMEREITAYLNSRRKGTLDWIQVQSAGGPDDVNVITRQLGMDPTKPVIALLSNVVWDAQVFYPTTGFSSMIEWLKVTIEYFIKRPDLQLLIRAHPGELQGYVKSRQLVVEEIKRLFPTLPANIFVIPPESPINTYAAIENCNAVLIYATTAGIELAGVGYQVVVAGESWIRGKGFSLDADGEAEYIALLDSLPLADRKLDREKLVRAQKYAYHHYFRRMIPLEMLDPQNSDNVPYRIKPVGIKGFMPGGDAGLDIICSGVLNNTGFTYEYEKLQNDDRKQSAHEFFTIGNKA